MKEGAVYNSMRYQLVAGATLAPLLWAGPLAHAAWLAPYIYQGQSGRQVSQLQRRLDRSGSHLPVSGSFGSQTEAAVRAFQVSHRLTVDGMVGPQTEGALQALHSGSNTAAPKFSAAPRSGSTYTVRPGDTLSFIASRFHTSWTALAALNHLANPNWLTVGQVLQVPGGTSRPSVLHAVPGISTTTYRVQNGDTLSAIASRFSTTWQALAQLNHLSDPNLLLVGQVLQVRGQASSNSSASSSVALAVQASALSFDQAIVNTAKAYLGTPYLWGGTTPQGFDCSGFTQFVFAKNGVNIPRTSWGQYTDAQSVPRSALVPGDLVFFNTYASGASHVGIYVGSLGGYRQAFIDAPAPGQTVMIQNLNNVYWVRHYYGAGVVTP